MSESKFTPGRWVWKYGNLYSENEGEKDKPVLTTDYDIPERTPDDANLIAAAPDLYHALEAAIISMKEDAISIHYNDYGERISYEDLKAQNKHPDVIDLAESALTKARGEWSDV